MNCRAPKKVLIVMSPIVRGGMELQICEILRLLDRELFEPFVCTVHYQENAGHLSNLSILPPSDEDVALQKEYRRLAVGMCEMPVMSGYNPRAAWRIFKIIQENQIDLVHVNLVIWGQMAGLLARVPTVQHVRVEISAFDFSKLSFFVNFCTCRFSKAVIAVSAAVEEQVATLWHVDRSRIQVVHSGIDIERFHPQRVNTSSDLRINLGIESAEKIVITVGNVRPVKGYEYFVQTASEIGQHRADVRFLLVGDGPSLEELKVQAYALGLQDRVLFLGRRDDIPQLLAMADVFVLTSLNEASPGSVKEAMAMELPVVATDVGGLPEVVEDGVSGFLVPPREPLAMADRVNWLLDNPAQARAFGRHGRAIVNEKFTNAQMVKSVEQVYKEVLGIA